MKETYMSKLMLELKLFDCFNKLEKYIARINDYLCDLSDDIESDDIINDMEDASYEITKLKELVSSLENVYKNEVIQYLKVNNKI